MHGLSVVTDRWRGYALDIDERKLDPALRRWIREDAAGERTVIVRIAFSRDSDEAAGALCDVGMTVQSSGPGVIVATSDGRSVRAASTISWITKIELPKRLDLKSRFQKP
jgi:hypothetical protein